MGAPPPSVGSGAGAGPTPLRGKRGGVRQDRAQASSAAGVWSVSVMRSLQRSQVPTRIEVQYHVQYGLPSVLQGWQGAGPTLAGVFYCRAWSVRTAHTGLRAQSSHRPASPGLRPLQPRVFSGTCCSTCADRVTSKSDLGDRSLHSMYRTTSPSCVEAFVTHPHSRRYGNNRI